MESAFAFGPDDFEDESGVHMEDDDDEMDRTTNVYVHIANGINADNELRRILPRTTTCRTLHIVVHQRHGYTLDAQIDFLTQVIVAFSEVEHIHIAAAKHPFIVRQDTSTNGDWPIELFTGVLVALRQERRSVLTIRLGAMKLKGTFRHFQDLAQCIRHLTSLEKFSLDKIGLEKIPGTTTPEEVGEGCWLGPIVEALASLPHLQDVRILGASDFPILSPSENGAENDEQPVIKSESLRELCRSASLRSLCLIHFNLTDDNVKEMAEQLETNLSLKEINIDCTLAKAGSYALARLLERNIILEDVNLCVRSPEDGIENADMTEEQLTQFDSAEDEINLRLAKGVGDSSLLNFALFRGRLSAKSQHAFRTMIVKQCSLQSLTLYCGDDDINATLSADPVIQFYCKLNTYGRRGLLLAYPPCEDKSSFPNPRSVFAPELSLVDTLGRVNDDLSCLFYLMSIQPSLCSRAIQKMELIEQAKLRCRRKCKSKRKAQRLTPFGVPTKRTRLYRGVKYTGVSYT